MIKSSKTGHSTRAALFLLFFLTLLTHPCEFLLIMFSITEFKPKHWYVKYDYLELGSPQVPSAYTCLHGAVHIPLQASERHFWTAIHPEGDALKPADDPSVSPGLDSCTGANQ